MASHGKNTDVVVTETELSAFGKPSKPSFRHNLGSRILQMGLILLFTLVLAISSQITYDYVRYQSFFVNGESMFPTLNADASFTDANGVYHDGGTLDSKLLYNWGDFTNVGTYLCDYGLMDSKSGFLSSLKRFDIVVTYFDSDFSSGVVSSFASLKIKRVIGLPGESLYFDSIGDLYVKSATDAAYSLLSQPFLEPNSSWNAITEMWGKSAKAQTASGIFYGTETNPCHLSDGQYFVCGDNRLRGASNDSRLIGPVSVASLVGKAVVVNAQCAYTIREDGSKDFHPVWNTFRMPWELRYLDE